MKTMIFPINNQFKLLCWCTLLWLGAMPMIAHSQNNIKACAGDSVVLRLNGYLQGDTKWEQSPDQTAWSTATGTSFKDSLKFTAQNSLHYRALIYDGVCDPYISDRMHVKINPTPLTALPATNITQNSFTAHWTSTNSTVDTFYFLEIAHDSAFTIGYQNYTVNNDTKWNAMGLACGLKYYYRVAFYSDSCQTISAWSNTISVTTNPCPPPAECTVPSTCTGDITDSRDGKTYKTVQIGTQCWMKQNLNVGKRIDGIIPQSQADAAIEKYCYNDNEANCTTYGGLYLWGEMMAYGPSKSTDPGPQGICPAGWHIPTDNEWTCLEKTLGGATIAGGKLKDTVLWNSPNTGATNSSGFSALPGGLRNLGGQFVIQGDVAYLLSTTESNAADAWNRYLDYTSAQVYRYSNTKMYTGFSVRCLKDN